MKTIISILLIVSAVFIAGCQTSPDPVTGHPEVSLSPAGSNTMATAGAIIEAGRAVPGPTQPIFELANVAYLGVAGFLAAYIRERNKKLQAKQALAATTTVIEGADNAVELKAAVTKAATANGSQDFLHSQVKNL